MLKLNEGTLWLQPKVIYGLFPLTVRFLVSDSDILSDSLGYM